MEADVGVTCLPVWDRRREGFREHIAIDGSLREFSGRDAVLWMASGAARLRQGRRAVVCCSRHNVGGSGSAKIDQLSRAVSFHHGLGKLDWTIHTDTGYY